MLLLDDGIITIYSLKNTAAAGAMPRLQLVYNSEHYYGEKVIGFGRQYAAKGVSEQIDMLVRIWHDRSVHIGMCGVIRDEQYRIDNVQHLLDKNGLRVTDLTLRRLDKLYEFAE